jgi:hypothetical protein
MTKKIMNMIIMFGLAAGICSAEFSANVRLTLQEAIQDAVADLARDPAAPTHLTIGILPLHNDRNGYVEGLVRSALSKAGYTSVEIRESDFWSRVQDEFAWQTRRGDILDSDTLLQFKNLMGTQLVLYGTVREATESLDRVYVETELHLSSLETTRHIWGGIFSRRSYLDAAIDGIVSLQPEVRTLLDTIIDQIAVSMKSASRLSDVQSIVVVNIAGDLENYIKGKLFQAMTNNTNLNPRDLGVTTLAEARQMLRAEPRRGEAVLYGSVRDLSRTLKSDLPLRQIYDVSAELQFTIQDVQSGDILWSMTQADRAEEIIETPKEDVAYSWITENPGTVRTILIVLGVLVLIVAYMFVSRPRRR